MGKLFLEYLEGSNVYTCRKCRAHLSKYSELISKGFRGRTGKAYLFNFVVNIKAGPAQEKMLMTGRHTTRDIFCKVCQSNVGWKYEHAVNEDQKYKEGKFILERECLNKEHWSF
eukprot:TRINITY_DN10877_c0_g1_i2.p1 TRINITY_DN10877_c0_g1~~TRINITY_DN10877_c0_g1_i2.p1  ORF type:complete len:114 (-),score=9.19 TRINITY_DN10877_c0_g1_i2:144-485(-)